MDYAEKAMELHRKLRGKLEMHTRTETGTREALSIAYTPGVQLPVWQSRRTRPRVMS